MLPGSRRVPRVLLATDLGPASAAATDAAIELARDLRGSLLVVSVLEPGRGTPFGARIDQIRERRERGARDIADRARAAGGAAAFLVWQGEPGPSVVAAAEAEGADFIILGSNQRPSASSRTTLRRCAFGAVSADVMPASRKPRARAPSYV